MTEQDQQDQRKVLIDKNNNIQYIRGKLLGTGGFAKCFEAINHENQVMYAAKVIPKKSISQKRQRYKLLIEIKIHRSLKHKHIVEFIETFQDRENVYILLEYCQNYTLKDLVKRRKRITEYETRIYIEQIVKALVYIHSQSIIHRDLKLGNILINEHMETKICDFGLSTRVKHEGEVKKTICGTPNYIAPEILQENGHSYQVDIWSIGVIMYTLLFGKPPFEDNTVQQTYENIKTNRFTYPSAIPISNMAKDLINRILVTNPAKRISLQQILQHEFMRHRQELPREIPSYTIAIPPIKIMQIESRQLSQHDTQLSDSMRGANSIRNNVNSSEVKKMSLESPEKQKLYTSAKSEFEQRAQMPTICIKECFAHDGIIGYLLSTGSIGIYYKNTGVNVVLEYGAQNYYIINRGSQQRPKRMPFPVEDFQKQYLKQSQQLHHLLNFRTFFLTKYSIFKLDELHKKYIQSIPQQSSSSVSNRALNTQQELVYIKKLMVLSKGEILTRLSNSIIQLHYNDLTSLMINHDENTGLFYINEKGKCKEVHYNQCRDSLLKTKIRMFSNLLQKLYKINNHAK